MAAPQTFQAALSGLLRGSLLFVGGKGGVGKTTIAAALGLAAADAGRRCLVVSTDPAHSLGDVLDLRVGADERGVTAGLWAIEIDPDEEAEQHITSVKLQMKGLVHPRMHGEVDRQLDLAALAPGTMEAALLERMADLIGRAGSDYDLILFDTAPTGHTLRLLALPELMMAWTEGLLRHDERASSLNAALERFGGTPPKDDLALLQDALASRQASSRAARLTEILRRRQQKLRRAREALLDDSTSGFVLVMNPDRLSVVESGRARRSLAKARVPVSAVVVNRVLPPDVPGAFMEARRRQEQEYLETIEQEFGDLPRVRLPMLPDDIHGIEALRRVADRLMAPDPVRYTR